MIIDHICFAVSNLDEGIEYWKSIFGYSQMTHIVENNIQKVKVVFLKKENSTLIKLIEPLAGNQPLQSFVSRGGGFHHLCFKCSDVVQQFKELTEKGLIPITAPQKGIAFNDNDIAFMHASNCLNIELIDTDEKAELI